MRSSTTYRLFCLNMVSSSRLQIRANCAGNTCRLRSWAFRSPRVIRTRVSEIDRLTSSCLLEPYEWSDKPPPFRPGEHRREALIEPVWSMHNRGTYSVGWGAVRQSLLQRELLRKYGLNVDGPLIACACGQL